MRRCARPKLKALPILNPAEFSLRSAISVLLTISESAPFIEATTRAVLDELSDAELEKHTRPKEITSISEAHTYLANIRTQSSEYTWIRNGQYIFLLAGSKRARYLGVPGVVFEFMIRTGKSQWIAYQIPDPDSVFVRPAYFYRNELTASSQRPVKSPILLNPKYVRSGLFRLGRTLRRVAMSLFA